MIKIYGIKNKNILKRANKHIEDFIYTFRDDLYESEQSGEEDSIYEEVFPKFMLRENKQNCISIIEDLSEWVVDKYIHTLKPVYEYVFYGIIQRCKTIGEELFKEDAFNPYGMNYNLTCDNIDEDDVEKILDLKVDTFDFYEDNCFEDLDFLYIPTYYEVYKMNPEILKIMDINLDYYTDLMPHDIFKEYKEVKKNRNNECNINEFNNDKKTRPKVFISYSWDNQNHNMWVLRLAATLLNNGIDTNMDVIEIEKSTVNLNSMMLNNIKKSDYVLVIMTENYANKADNEIGGVGFETKYLVNCLIKNPNKIIPILKENTDKAIPQYLEGIYYYDLSDKNTVKKNLKKLIYKIYGKNNIEMPKLGHEPHFESTKIDTFDIDF